MKKTFVAVVLCMTLLSSFTVSASAYDINDVYNQVAAIRNEFGYPQGNWSSLRRAVNYIADHMPDSSPNLEQFKQITETMKQMTGQANAGTPAGIGDGAGGEGEA